MAMWASPFFGDLKLRAKELLKLEPEWDFSRRPKLVNWKLAEP